MFQRCVGSPTLRFIWANDSNAKKPEVVLGHFCWGDSRFSAGKPRSRACIMSWIWCLFIRMILLENGCQHSSMDQTNMWNNFCMCQRLPIQKFFSSVSKNSSPKVRIFMLPTVKKPILAGGFEPFETHESNWIISPQIGLSIQKIFELPPPGASMCCPENS